MLSFCGLRPDLFLKEQAETYHQLVHGFDVAIDYHEHLPPFTGLHLHKKPKARGRIDKKRSKPNVRIPA